MQHFNSGRISSSQLYISLTQENTYCPPFHSPRKSLSHGSLKHDNTVMVPPSGACNSWIHTDYYKLSHVLGFSVLSKRLAEKSISKTTYFVSSWTSSHDSVNQSMYQIMTTFLQMVEICTSLQTDNHASTPPLISATQRTASQHWRQQGRVAI